METFSLTTQSPRALPMEQVSFNFEEIKVTYRDKEHDSWIGVLSGR